MEIYNIHHVCIYTPEIEKSINFYQDIMGFNLIGRETCDFGEYAMLKLRLLMILSINSVPEFIKKYITPVKKLKTQIPTMDFSVIGSNIDDRGVKFTPIEMLIEF